MRRRFALIYNSSAGQAVPRLLDGVLAALRRQHATIFQVPARNAKEAAQNVVELARQGGCDAVIATGAAGTALPVGVIPLGTGNVLAREFGLLRRPSAVADMLLSGAEMSVRGGLVNGEPFFLMAGAGFDARIVARLKYRTKRTFGRGAYTYPLIKTLSEEPHFFDVDLDGRRFEASWVILTFASRYAGAFVLTRDTQVGHGVLMAIVIEARSRLAIMGSVMSLAMGWLARPESRPAGVHVLPVRHAHIGRLEHVAIEIDGDEAGFSPVEIVAEGPVVRVIAPSRYVADLTNRRANHLAYDS